MLYNGKELPAEDNNNDDSEIMKMASVSDPDLAYVKDIVPMASYVTKANTDPPTQTETAEPVAIPTPSQTIHSPQ
jgi:hypothetical protein